jgi:hypothetical protein
LNIRFTSSLTPEDENTVAPALLKALAAILDLLPIAYAIRIDTSDAQVYQQRSAEANSTHQPARTRSAGAHAGGLELR